MAQVIPLFEDKCAGKADTCQMDSYAESCWNQIGQELVDGSHSKDEFVNTWAESTSKEFGVDADEIESLFKAGDKHNSDTRTRAAWKYTAALGVSGTPAATVNGVRLDNYPMTADEWKSLL